MTFESVGGVAALISLIGTLGALVIAIRTLVAAAKTWTEARIALERSQEVAVAREHEQRLALAGLARVLEEDILRPDDFDMATALAGALQSHGALPAARQQYEQALARREAALGPDHPDVAAAHSNLGSVLQALGELPAARQQYERALMTSVVALGPDHPSVAIRRNNYGNLLGLAGDYQGARNQLEHALTSTEAVLGPEHLNVATIRLNLGNVLGVLGDTSAARQQYELALAIREAALGPDHPDVASIRARLASDSWIAQMSDASTTPEAATGSPANSSDQAARAIERGIPLPEAPSELFLADMRRRAEAAADRARNEARVLEGREQTVFRSLIAVAAATAVAAIAGVVLIFTGALTVAIVSGAIGVMTGGGTLALRNMSKEHQHRRRELLQHEREDSQLLATIGVALLIPDAEKRNHALSELARSMVERMSPPPAQETGTKRAHSSGRKGQQLPEDPHAAQPGHRSSVAP